MSLDYSDFKDSKLVKLASEQDDQAFTELLNRYREYLRNCCMKFSRNMADAEDLFQKASLKAWKSLPKFRADCHFKSWMYKIIRNLAYDFSDWRKRKAEVPLVLSTSSTTDIAKTWMDVKELSEVGTYYLPSCSDESALQGDVIWNSHTYRARPKINTIDRQDCYHTPDRELEKRENSKELGELLKKSLKNLSPEHLECLERLSEGMTYEEIAKIQKVPLGTIMSRVFNARKKAQKKCADLKHFEV